MLRYLQKPSSRQCGRQLEFIPLIRSNGELKMKRGARLNARLGGFRGLPYWNTVNNILSGKPSLSGRMPLRRRNTALPNGYAAWLKEVALA